MNLRTNPLAHRTVLLVPPDAKPLAEVRRVSADWLREKYGDAPLTSGSHRLDATSVLAFDTAYRADGAEDAVRLQLRQDQAEATWRTTVTARSLDSEDALVCVALEMFPNSEGEAPAPGRPRLIRQLVDDLRPRDGLAALTSSPQTVPAGRVDPLIDILCDPERQLPVIVAASPLQPSSVWSYRMGKVGQASSGAASLYLLEDTDAVDAFRAAIGEDHRVAPGAVRTFLTDVDPAWRQDGARHRFLSVARMSDGTDQAWRAISFAVQRMATDSPLPDTLSELSFPAQAQQRSQQRQDALATAGHSSELVKLRADVEELKSLLMAADEEVTERGATAALAERTVTALQRELHDSVTRADADTEEALRAMEEAERARAEASTLRSRLHQQGRPHDTVIVEVPPQLPASFEELWERLGEFTGLTVTADKARALDLDNSDRGRVWAAKAWNALLALDSYAQSARTGFAGGFLQHATCDRPGTVSWPPKQVAMAESNITMSKWGDERVLPVPEEFDPSGESEMQAHLKLGSKGSTSPRVYFLDDTKGVTTTVIIGYIGPHLTNTKT